MRLAEEKDVDEVLRLATLMWEDMELTPTSGPWEKEYRRVFYESLQSESIRVFVADHPTEDGRLIACGIALYYQLMPAYWLTNGRMGYLQWFSVDREFRGEGIGTRILETARNWLVEAGCERMHLHSSPKAMALYERGGFSPSYFTNMWHSAEPNAPR